MPGLTTPLLMMRDDEEDADDDSLQRAGSLVCALLPSPLACLISADSGCPYVSNFLGARAASQTSVSQ